jgi:two-component system LytT family response regulator
VDDEELARGYLRELLRAHEEIEIAAECANGFEAVKAIAESSPDLLFLDVQMPKLDGFEVLELVDPGPAVIFVTAFDQYAMRAFDARAVDYLLKPFSAERFERSLARAKERIRERRLPLELAAERPPSERPQRIVVKDGTRVHVIPLDMLDYVEAQDDYIAVVRLKLRELIGQSHRSFSLPNRRTGRRPRIGQHMTQPHHRTIHCPVHVVERDLAANITAARLHVCFVSVM